MVAILRPQAPQLTRIELWHVLPFRFRLTRVAMPGTHSNTYTFDNNGELSLVGGSNQ
jgi:hypothetical protein